MKAFILSFGLLASFDLFAAQTHTIYNFFPKEVACVDDVSGTRGAATGIGGEGGGEIDVRIIGERIKGSQKAYRNTLCETLRAAMNNGTAVDLVVRDMVFKEPEGPSKIQAVISITVGHAFSQ